MKDFLSRDPTAMLNSQFMATPEQQRYNAPSSLALAGIPPPIPEISRLDEMSRPSYPLSQSIAQSSQLPSQIYGTVKVPVEPDQRYRLHAFQETIENLRPEQSALRRGISVSVPSAKLFVDFTLI